MNEYHPTTVQHYQLNSVQDYHDEITELFNEYYSSETDVKPTSNERVEGANNLIEHYIERHGKRPPNAILSRLATCILLDTLTDSHPDKMSREEYPIMSYGQTGRHFERNIPAHDLQYDSADVRGYITNALTGDKNVLFDVDTDEDKAMLWRLFIDEVLTEREALIVRRLYGDGVTQAKVANELGVSRQRVGAVMSGVYDKLSEIIVE